MPAGAGSHKAVFKVLDAMDAPHGGRILKLRLQSGEPPPVKSLKGAEMRATSPDGASSCTCKVDGFVLFGGRPSDERLARTGRVDVHVSPGEGDFHEISSSWEISETIS
jgi:hypothetical protein